MPVVQIHLMEGRTEEQKRVLVQKVTEAMCEALSIKPERIRIMLNDISLGDYAIGGKLMKDINKEGQ